jgi:hypothetical protein
MSSPIKDVTLALNRHADVVERALGGLISEGEEASRASIAGLRQASALRAAGQEGFRLHPRLREFLFDHLQLFPAYQSLTEIGSRISQMQALWSEVDSATRDGDRDTLHSLLDSLNTVVYDIADGMERNLHFLSGLLSTKYGNVQSLSAKISQNRYYQHQSAGLASDMNRLERLATILETEAETRRMPELARLIRQEILDKAALWQHGLAEMHIFLRRELFRTREVHTSLKHLARADTFLRQQPAWRGFEIELGEQIPDVLLAARLPRIAAHVEPLDPDKGVREALYGILGGLPARKEPAPPAGPPRRYKYVPAPREDDSEEQQESPLALALDALDREVLQAGGSGVGLAEWRSRVPAAAALQEGVWLMFTVVALRGRGRHVDLVLNPPADGELYAQTFCDARAFRADPLLTPLPASPTVAMPSHR